MTHNTEIRPMEEPMLISDVCDESDSINKVGYYYLTAFIIQSYICFLNVYT